MALLGNGGDTPILAILYYCVLFYAFVISSY